LLNRFVKNCAAFLVEVEEHVLLAGEVIEDGHAPDASSCCDVVHRHMIETPLEE